MPTRKAPDQTQCITATQILCRGLLETDVTGVCGQAARNGQPHISVRYGRLLLYIEDRAALMALVAAVDRANDLSSTVFGPLLTPAAARDALLGIHVAKHGSLPRYL